MAEDDNPKSGDAQSGETGKPAARKPVRRKPSGRRSAGPKPAQEKPAEAKPAQEKPSEAKPAEAKPAAVQEQAGKTPFLRITAKVRNGFRRCGVRHPAEPADHPLDRFSEREIRRLKDDPNLIVEEIMI